MKNSAKSESEAVARMRAFIASNLQTQITAHDVAQAAGYSQYHAARVFQREIGMTPFEYIRRERLTAAAVDLRHRHRKVIDVAFDYVFDSHEGFTRSFANGFGIPPKRFSSAPSPEGWNIPFIYLDRKIASTREHTMNSTSVIFTQILDRPQRKLILKRSRNARNYFEYVEEFGCGDQKQSAPWDILTGIPEALYEPVGLWLPENMRPEGTGEYAHGVEVPDDYAGDGPEGFDVISLPPAKMLVFQGEPYNDAEYQAAVAACMNRIETYNPATYGYAYEPEIAPRMQLAPAGWRGYIEMRPVRKITE